MKYLIIFMLMMSLTCSSTYVLSTNTLEGIGALKTNGYRIIKIDSTKYHEYTIYYQDNKLK
jgi:hypothetical protein